MFLGGGELTWKLPTSPGPAQSRMLILTSVPSGTSCMIVMSHGTVSHPQLLRQLPASLAVSQERGPCITWTVTKKEKSVLCRSQTPVLSVGPSLGLLLGLLKS